MTRTSTQTIRKNAKIFPGADPEPIKISGVVEDSVVDGPGYRFAVFVQGCPHDCEGCHNGAARDFDGGITADIYKIAEKIIKSRSAKEKVKVTFSGGEPFEQAGELAKIARLVREFREADIITYTGYLLEELLEAAEYDYDVRDLLEETNYIIDGKFEIDKKRTDCFYRGSSNQRIFDVTCYPNSTKVRQVETREDF